MKIAVQMNAPHRLNPKGDSTIVLLREAAKRGYVIYYYDASTLGWLDGKVTAQAQALDITEGEHWYNLETAQTLDLAGMDVILVRQDPPFDMGYITATYLLDRLKHVAIVNNPTSVRNFPEKLLPLDYPDAMPDTLISASRSDILAFLAQYKDIILKPLYGWGGHSVLRLRNHGDNVEALLEMLFERDSLPVIAQPFLPEVASQDVRVILIGGRIIGAFARTPASGEVRANMRVGGQPVAYALNDAQVALCERIAPDLHHKGLYFAGLDFIGNHLTEINVTSPTGLKTLENLYGINAAQSFWDNIH